MTESNEQRREGKSAADTPHHFTLLLVALLLLFVAAPISSLIKARYSSQVGPWLMMLVLLFDILLAAFLASKGRRDRSIAAFLMAPTLIAYAVCLVAGSDRLWVLAHALGAAFLIYTIILMVKHVFTARRVSWDTVSAALCIYLLFAIAYALLYSILFTLNAQSFSFNVDAATSSGLASEVLIRALYYSLVTMTTLGYGDITPTTPVTQMAAAIQALVGQLYVAVLVARLVGMQVASSMAQHETDS